MHWRESLLHLDEKVELMSAQGSGLLLNSSPLYQRQLVIDDSCILNITLVTCLQLSTGFKQAKKYLQTAHIAFSASLNCICSHLLPLYSRTHLKVIIIITIVIVTLGTGRAPFSLLADNRLDIIGWLGLGFGRRLVLLGRAGLRLLRSC